MHNSFKYWLRVWRLSENTIQLIVCVGVDLCKNMPPIFVYSNIACSMIGGRNWVARQKRSIHVPTAWRKLKMPPLLQRFDPPPWTSGF